MPNQAEDVAAMHREFQSYCAALDLFCMHNDLIGSVALMRERMAPVVTIKPL